MDSPLLTLSQEFFKEHFNGFERIDILSLLVDASDVFNNLSHLAFEDGDIKQSIDMGRLSFEIDCLVDVLSDTLKS